jgi:type IV pilus assembly protein PilQ
MNTPPLCLLKKLQRWVFFLTGMAFSVVAMAQGVIESVSAALQGGAEVVRIELSRPLGTVPPGFSIQSPARIALDFDGFSNGSGRSIVEINQGNLKSVVVAQAGERSRVVLNLKVITTYKTQQQGKTLLVFLDPVPSTAATATVAPVFAENRNRDALALKDLDFRLGPAGSGKVVVALANDQVGVDIRQQGQTLVVEFMKTLLPEGLRRRLDVSDFGTPIQSVTTSQVGDRVRMVIEPSGAWEHSAYQSDSQFVVEVRPLKPDASKLTQGLGFTGEKLSLNFQNIEVRSLLQVIADFTNFNIITSDSVTGSVTLRLKDVPWDQAFQIILDAKSLGLRKTGNVLLIAPKEELDTKTKKDLEAAQAIQNLEPLRTQSFQMNYAKAADVAAQINATGGTANSSRILSARGSAMSEPRTNQLFVTDIASKLEQVQQLIAKLDIAVRQVVIEARIVEASDAFGKSIGVRLGGSDLRAQKGGDGGYQLSGNNRIAIGTSYGNVVGSSGAGGTVDTSGTFVNLPSLGALGNAPATFALSIFNATANRFLNLELSALEADGKGKIVSSPRVVTADQSKAVIEQGTEVPYQQASSSGATSIAFKKANLKLEVTPQITPEGNIILELEINKDALGLLTPAGYAIDTKHIKTQVLVENGGTVVIGGIFSLDENESDTRVPVLGDIPYVGNLFKSKSKTTTKKEMLVFITPKMISERSTVR